MLLQEEEWKHDVEATIAMKDARSKMIQMEKDEMIQEVGALYCVYIVAPCLVLINSLIKWIR